MYMLEVYQLHLWRRVVTFLFCVSFFFFQLRLGSQSTYNYCRNCTFVCTGQRLVRARVVLSSTPGLASRKHFAIFSSNTTYSRGVFFHLGSSFFQACFSSTRANPGFYEANRLYFSPSAGGLKTKTKKTKQKKRQQHVWYVRVIRVHIHMYSMIRIYYDITTTLQQCCCM